MNHSAIFIGQDEDMDSQVDSFHTAAWECAESFDCRKYNNNLLTEDMLRFYVLRSMKENYHDEEF